MPSRNVLKIDAPETFYHVYARGNSKQAIFLQPHDYAVFMNLLKRYLSSKPAKNADGREYPHLRKKAELLCFCLMRNHFHLLIYQQEVGAMSQLMRGLMTSYSRYFNTTHKRNGPLFESRYKASMINSDRYIMHISRYIHLNPTGWKHYKYSSMDAYLGNVHYEWLQPERILEMFKNEQDYLNFVSDYEEYKQTLDAVKYELAEN